MTNQADADYENNELMRDSLQICLPRRIKLGISRLSATPMGAYGHSACPKNGIMRQEKVERVSKRKTA